MHCVIMLVVMARHIMLLIYQKLYIIACVVYHLDLIKSLILLFNSIDYSDLSTELSDQNPYFKPKSVYEPAAFAIKNLKISGVSLYMDEFHEAARTMPPGFDCDSPHSPPPSPTVSSPSMSACFESVASQLAKSEKSSLLPSIQIGRFSGKLEVKLKLKQNVAVPGSKVCKTRETSQGGILNYHS